MKNNRTIKTIVATVCVMVTLCAGLVGSIYKSNAETLEETINAYEMQIMGLNEDNDRLVEVNQELRSDMSELEHQVYCMMSGDEYRVRIHEDDTTYIYEGVKDGWFMERTVMTIK